MVLLEIYNDFDFWVAVFSCIIALAIAGFSFRAFFHTHLKRHAAFGLAFLSLAAGMLGNAIFTYFVAFENYTIPLRGFLALTYRADLVLLLSLLCIFTGYLLIFIVNEGIKNIKTIFLLLFLAPLTVLVSHYFYEAYHLVSVFLVFFLYTNFATNYRKEKTANAFLVAAAFATILISEVVFLFMTFNAWLYFLGNFLRLVGFGLFLIALIRIYRK